MKLFRMCAATVAALMMSISAADAGLLNNLLKGGECGAAKSCGCAETCQPTCCKPTIARPCHTNVYVYQRKCSDIKPPCCDTCCPEECCEPASCCAPAECCAPKECCAPTPKECCAPEACCAPAPKECCAPAECCAPKECCAPAPKECCAPTCCAPAECCEASCCEQECCCVDTCRLAQLIYQSQTCCYAKDRKKAIDELGDDFDCICSPEIMVAFVYALNDCDERVRKEAADEIGDQIRKHGCCCSPEVVAALTCALADCDKGVRKQAEEALECCGYEIVDGCCDTCCDTSCGPACGPGAAPMNNDNKMAPPAPPSDKEANFKSKLNIRSAKKSGLANLFGLAR